MKYDNKLFGAMLAAKQKYKDGHKGGVTVRQVSEFYSPKNPRGAAAGLDRERAKAEGFIELAGYKHPANYFKISRKLTPVEIARIRAKYGL